MDIRPENSPLTQKQLDDETISWTTIFRWSCGVASLLCYSAVFFFYSRQFRCSSQKELFHKCCYECFADEGPSLALDIHRFCIALFAWIISTVIIAIFQFTSYVLTETSRISFLNKERVTQFFALMGREFIQAIQNVVFAIFAVVLVDLVPDEDSMMICLFAMASVTFASLMSMDYDSGLCDMMEAIFLSFLYMGGKNEIPTMILVAVVCCLRRIAMVVISEVIIWHQRSLEHNYLSCQAAMRAMHEELENGGIVDDENMNKRFEELSICLKKFYTES